MPTPSSFVDNTAVLEPADLARLQAGDLDSSFYPRLSLRPEFQVGHMRAFAGCACAECHRTRTAAGRTTRLSGTGPVYDVTTSCNDREREHARANDLRSYGTSTSATLRELRHQRVYAVDPIRVQSLRLAVPLELARREHLALAEYGLAGVGGLPLHLNDMTSIARWAVDRASTVGYSRSLARDHLFVARDYAAITSESFEANVESVCGWAPNRPLVDPEAYAVLYAGDLGVSTGRGVGANGQSLVLPEYANAVLRALHGCRCTMCQVVRWVSVAQGLLRVHEYMEPGDRSGLDATGAWFVPPEDAGRLTSVARLRQLYPITPLPPFLAALHVGENARHLAASHPSRWLGECFTWASLIELNLAEAQSIRALGSGRTGREACSVRFDEWLTALLRAEQPGARTLATSAPIKDDGLTVAKFGVEIECLLPGCDTASAHAAARSVLRSLGLDADVAQYGHTTARYWKVTTDGSVGEHSSQLVSKDQTNGGKAYQGAEVVSPILTSTTDVTRVVRALARAGAKVNRTCGLHVHVDAGEFTLEHWKRLLRIYACFEPAVDTFMPRSRRGNANQYCASLSSVSPSGLPGFLEMLASAPDLEHVKSAIFRGGRYFKLNVMSFWRHGTVEFRHHAGTLNAGKITRWVRLLDAIVAYALSRLPLPEPVAVTSIEAMFSKLAAVRSTILHERGLVVPEKRPSSREHPSTVGDRAWSAMRSARGATLVELSQAVDAIDWDANRVPARTVRRTADEFFVLVQPQLVDSLAELECFFSERAQELAEM